jgi:primosomal protein N' (replication factor Y) (superfamily II helicase)
LTPTDHNELLFDNKAAAYAEIIIPLALPMNYTWSLSEDLLAKAKTGVRAEVTLKNKKYAGIIKRVVKEKPEAFDPKPVLNILDETPVVYPEQLKLWEWMANYYMCSEGEVMQAALPTHFKLSSETILLFNEEAGEDFSHLDAEEFLVAEALLIKKQLSITEVQQILEATHVYPVIKRLLDQKICMVWEELKTTYKQKTASYVKLHPDYSSEEALSKLLNEDKKLQRAEKQVELLLAYLHYMKTEGEVTQPELLKKANATAAQLKGLTDKQILVIEKRAVDRIRYLPKNIQLDFVMSAAQQHALAAVEHGFADKQVCLLHGVTSSGKTLIYISLMSALVKAGKQVLYMLPEIALTSQIIRRLQKHFGGHIAVYHSKFSHNERLEVWNKVRSGEAKIILGARSSLFLPFTDLNLIICDEEHDASYKQQEPAPRYHARDAAIYFASLFNCKVLLGSATPSVESFYNAKASKYALATLTERFGDIALPAIEIIDTKKIITKDRAKVIISPQLREAIESNLQKGKQVILFQNRRGYSPYQVCQACGWIPQCRHCDVSLTYHKMSNKLQCHYCGTAYSMITTCGACGNHDFAQQNFGTERIEEELQEQFPAAHIARMDIDSVKGKNAHDTLIQAFEQKRVEILVGTQMVVKGLDFEHVDLVGILDADALLGFAHFRVNERAFQLMEQVSGRAGRKDKQGHVMIQVRNTNHPVLHYVQQHNYNAFYEEEIQGRKRFAYPPFSRIIQVTLRHKSNDIVREAAIAFSEKMRSNFENYMVGPAQPVVNRVRNQYLMELMFKLPKDSSVINSCKQQITEAAAILHQQKQFRLVTIIADVDAI